MLYISIHRYEKANFWPNLREANYDYVGHGSGRGFNVNIPLEQVSELFALVLPWHIQFAYKSTSFLVPLFSEL